MEAGASGLPSLVVALRGGLKINTGRPDSLLRSIGTSMADLTFLGSPAPRICRGAVQPAGS